MIARVELPYGSRGFLRGNGACHVFYFPAQFLPWPRRLAGRPLGFGALCGAGLLWVVAVGVNLKGGIDVGARGQVWRRKAVGKTLLAFRELGGLIWIYFH